MNLNEVMQTNMAALKDMYPLLKIRARVDPLDPNQIEYLFHSPERDVYTRLTTPLGQDVSVKSKWHEEITRFYDRHQSFIENEGFDSFDGPATTGNLNSLFY